MLEWLNALDTQLFLSINGNFNAFFDFLMSVISYKFTWLPLYLTVLTFIVIKWKRRSVWIILAIIICITLSDQIASGLFKSLFHRLRPSHEPSLQSVIHLVNGFRGGLYGFASSHAANTFAFAVFTSLLFRIRWYSVAIFTWAFLNSYSRIYLGLHYPLDILAGIAIGVGISLFCFWLLKKNGIVPVIFSRERTTD